jgi:hypothetical protein
LNIQENICETRCGDNSTGDECSTSILYENEKDNINYHSDDALTMLTHGGDSNKSGTSTGRSGSVKSTRGRDRGGSGASIIESDRGGTGTSTRGRGRSGKGTITHGSTSLASENESFRGGNSVSTLGRSRYGRGKSTCETESDGGGTVTASGSEMPSTAGVNLACPYFTRSHRYATVKDLKEMRRSFHVQTIHVQMKTYQYLLHLAQLKIQSVLFVTPT